MSAYQGVQGWAYDEALRLVPGLSGARMREAPKDADVLLAGYLADCAEQGIAEGTAWSIMAAAAITWTTQLLTVTATERNESLEDVVADAVEWVNDRSSSSAW